MCPKGTSVTRPNDLKKVINQNKKSKTNKLNIFTTTQHNRHHYDV